MYSISAYVGMIADSVRTDAYARALRSAVTPGSVVVDIGTGTGFFAMLACQYGARRVYAIEPDNAICVAQEIAAANGYTSHIEFIQDFSTSITLPERADVIISDMRGMLPFFQNHIPAIADARRRFLKSDGVMIPQQDRLWAALAEAPDLYGKITNPWASNLYDVDMRAGWRIVANTWRKGKVTPEQLLVEPQLWASIDYARVDNPDIVAELNWTIEKPGVAHGIAIWFDTTLVDGVDFSNAPGLPELIYGSPFFPLAAPIALAKHDHVCLRLFADLVRDDYVWRWNTRVISGANSNEIKVDFKQSTFFGTPLSPSQLRKRSAPFVPMLNDDGEVERFILSLMDGKTSLKNVATQLKYRFPDKFADPNKALTRVGEVSLKHSK